MSKFEKILSGVIGVLSVLILILIYNVTILNERVKTISISEPSTEVVVNTGDTEIEEVYESLDALNERINDMIYYNNLKTE